MTATFSTEEQGSSIPCWNETCLQKHTEMRQDRFDSRKISRTERFTPMPQLAPPSPVVVCLGMSMRGKGRASFGWFQSWTWKTSEVSVSKAWGFSWLDNHLKPLSMFLMGIIVSLGGEMHDIITGNRSYSGECQCHYFSTSRKVNPV